MSCQIVCRSYWCLSYIKRKTEKKHWYNRANPPLPSTRTQVQLQIKAFFLSFLQYNIENVQYYYRLDRIYWIVLISILKHIIKYLKWNILSMLCGAVRKKFSSSRDESNYRRKKGNKDKCVCVSATFKYIQWYVSYFHLIFCLSILHPFCLCHKHHRSYILGVNVILL